jgi:hypothetical protein
MARDHIQANKLKPSPSGFGSLVLATGQTLHLAFRLSDKGSFVIA